MNSIPPFRILCLGLSLALSTNAFAADSIAVKPGDSVLLLDEHTVARTEHLTQNFFPAKKYPQNPLIKRTEDWEGRGP